MDTKKIDNCQVMEVSSPSDDLCFLKIATEAPVPLPGQFAMLRGHWGDAPLLPRAISYCDGGPGWALFLFRAHGAGTRRLARLRPGDFLQVTGPLGNAFPTEYRSPWLVAGGIGLPPLWFFQKLHGGRLFWGIPCATMAGGLLDPSWELACDDGGAGFHGTCVRLMEMALSGTQDPPDALFTCGPNAMMAAVARAGREHGIPVHVSLEGRMACGVGVCCGCAHPATGGGYVHVCECGPVFPSDEVLP